MNRDLFLFIVFAFISIMSVSYIVYLTFAQEQVPLLPETTLYTEQIKIINFTGTVWSDGYTFHFIENCTQAYLERYNRTQRCAGFTEGTGEIWLQTNYTDYIVWQKCNHELCHNIVEESNFDLEEEICRRIDTVLDYPTCNKVLEAVAGWNGR